MYFDSKSINKHLSVIHTRTGHTVNHDDVRLFLDLIYSGLCVMMTMDYYGGAPDEIKITLRFRYNDKATVTNFFKIHNLKPIETGESTRTNIYFVSINIGDNNPAKFTEIQQTPFFEKMKNKFFSIYKR